MSSSIQSNANDWRAAVSKKTTEQSIFTDLSIFVIQRKSILENVCNDRKSGLVISTIASAILAQRGLALVNRSKTEEKKTYIGEKNNFLGVKMV